MTFWGVYPTLQAYNGGGGRCDGICYCLEGNTVDRKSNKNGKGWCEAVSPTLNTQDKHAVCYPETARALTARHDSSPCVDRGQNVVAIDCRNMVGNEELSGTLQAKSNGGQSLNYQNPICYRAGGYGDMVEGVGTLRANGGDAGGVRRASSLSVFDARGNGEGIIVPTMTGHHNANISDYTALIVERNDE